MTLLDALEDLRGCTLVHLDKGSGLAVFWNGHATFVEYYVGRDGNVTQGDAWACSKRPSSVQDAIGMVVARYGVVTR